MKFPQDFIDRVREATDLVPLISQYVQLRRTGGNYQGLCPFHGEKTPSFSVSEEKQVYFCFGCKASGNVFSFVQNYQGMTFPETIEYLAKRASIALPEKPNDAGAELQNQKSTFYKINALAAQFYHQALKNLPANHLVKKYLETRGLDEELVNTYKLGYAPEAWSELATYFENKRVPVAPAEQLGLVKRRNQDKNGHYDLFRHRVMFPIFSPTKECLGFGGRVLSKDQQPKYLNSPDSPVFHKGKVFYGLDTAAKYIRSEDEAIVVEGYMDWLALAKVSINNMVATLGTALTLEHAKLIKRYTHNVLLLFDGDEAGKSAARRSLPILLAEGVKVRGLFLPDKLDPDEFIQAKGAPALRQLIQSAPDLFDLIAYGQWTAAKGSPSGKIQLLDEFAPVLAQIADIRLRTLYSQNLARMIDVDVVLVEQSVTRAAAGRPHPGSAIRAKEAPPGMPSPTPAMDKIDLAKGLPAEIEILNLMLMKEVYLKEALRSAVGDEFKHSGCRAVFQRIAEVYRLMPNKFDTLSASLADEVTPVETITRHLSEPYASLTSENGAKFLQDCIVRVKRDFSRVKSKELISSLRGTGEINPSEQLEQIMNIHKNRKSLNSDS